MEFRKTPSLIPDSSSPNSAFKSLQGRMANSFLPKYIRFTTLVYISYIYLRSILFIEKDTAVDRRLLPSFRQTDLNFGLNATTERKCKEYQLKEGMPNNFSPFTTIKK